MNSIQPANVPIIPSLSRRAALAAAISGAGIAMLGPAHVTVAQGATPVATPVTSDEAVFLFVQASFTSGTLAANADGSYALTLLGAPAQSLYFSDRPARIVGSMPTERFLDVLGFEESDPPNAALVIQADAENTDVIVFELTAPVYDAATGSLAYTAVLLEGFDQLEETGVGFTDMPLTAETLPSEFGPSSLFIDSLLGCSPIDPRGC
jgi:hypothetical protein